MQAGKCREHIGIAVRHSQQESRMDLRIVPGQPGIPTQKYLERSMDASAAESLGSVAFIIKRFPC